MSGEGSPRPPSTNLNEYRVPSASQPGGVGRYQASLDALSQTDSGGEKAQSSPEPKPLSVEANGSREVAVLVADDNSTNVEVVSRMLKLEKVNAVSVARVRRHKIAGPSLCGQQTLTVTTVTQDGQEAYDLVKANFENGRQFDLILMDIQVTFSPRLSVPMKSAGDD